MTPVIYRATARTNLKDIELYFRAYSDTAYENVMEDIQSTLQAIQTFPTCGTPLSDNRRRFSTTRYKFVISYLFAGEKIEVLGIYRYQNK